MGIRVIIEPEYQNSFWCRETMKGLTNQAYLRKVRLTRITEQELAQGGEALSEDMITVLGSSINWIRRIVALIHDRGLLSLLVSSDLENQIQSHTNSLLFDYRESMRGAISYLLSSGEKKIALFGVNPSSYTDNVKQDAFPWKDDIYYNYGCVADCAAQLWENIEQYTAIVCVNSMVAVFLLRFLQEKGVAIPQKLRLISFGDSLLSRMIQPVIPCFEDNIRALGAQAVNVGMFLSRNPELTIHALIKCPLRIRESAQTVRLFPAPSENYQQSPDVNFYADESIISLLALNHLLAETDALDLQILYALLQKKTQEKIAEEQHLSLSSLRYRLRKMRSYFPRPTEMLDLIRRYLPQDVLAQAIQLRQEQE